MVLTRNPVAPSRYAKDHAAEAEETMLMSRLVAAVGAVALVVPLLAVDVLGASGDSVSGHGRLSLGDASAAATVTARSDPSGGGASGVIRIDRTGEHTVSGVVDVDCLVVDGNRAVVGGYLRSPVPNPNEPGTFYQRIFVHITDHGPPGHGSDTWNTALRWGEPGTVTGTSCPGFLGGAPADAGNFTVVDH
jgi:hypothetical protein